MRGIGRRNFLSSFYLKKWQMLFKPKAKEEKPEEGNRSGVLGMSSILLKATESNHKVLRWRNHPDAKAILRILSVYVVGSAFNFECQTLSRLPGSKLPESGMQNVGWPLQSRMKERMLLDG